MRFGLVYNTAKCVKSHENMGCFVSVEGHSKETRGFATESNITNV
jgi:hypothetical protein